MDCICSFFEIGKKVWEVAGGYCINFINLRTNMNRLELDRNSLSARAKDTDALANEQLTAKPGTIRKEEVVAWLKEVQVTEEAVQGLEKEVEEESNFFKRGWLAQQVVGKIEEVEKVKAKGIFPDGVVIDAPPPKGMLIPMEEFFSKAASAKNHEKVRKYLTEHKFTRIGIVGMGGAGKTTVMKQIQNEMIKGPADCFDQVIWLTVSKEFNIEKIQNSIAKQLYHTEKDYEKFEKSKDEIERKMALCTKFSTEKRYLLMLDDVWKPFPLEKVGVSKSGSVTLVLTTRSKDVCTKMGCELVEVELLTEQEANDLFMETVALPDDKLASEVKEIAKTVAKECARLPLAIITVARNMRKKDDLHTWRDQLRQISSKESKDIEEVFSDDERNVLELLKFSYSCLKNEKHQKCFLYCAMYPEDFNIPENELIEYWIVEGLIDEMDSREAMFDKGHCILNELLNIYLLERGQESFSFWTNPKENEKYVRMHDLIREMSLQITSTSPRYVVHSGHMVSEEVLFDPWSQNPVKVSLLYSNYILPSDPDPPICGLLTTLLLRGNRKLDVIPDSFFAKMSHLEVLDLSYTSIQSLPKSISALENLHALLAGNCPELEYVPSLEKLKELKELNLCGSQISEIPEGLEELVNLRNLDLFDTKKLESFDSCKLRRLSKLQLLRIDKSKMKVSAADLWCLNKLEVVCAEFQNGKELISYLDSPQCQRLEKYRLYVESFHFYDYWGDLEEEIGKKVRVYGGTVVDRQVFPNNVETLDIRACDFDIKIGSSDIMPWKNTKDLRKFALDECCGIELIFSENCQTPLRSVEELRLSDLPDLKVLFHEVAPAGDISFKLKRLYISRCSGIKNIFPAMLLQNNFPTLEELSVEYCENVKEIIVDEDVEMSRKTITLPNLKSICLRHLPVLESIYKGTIVSTSLKEIKLRGSPMLKRLPFSCSHTNDCQQRASLAPVFPSIDGEQIWRESMESVLFREVAPAGDISFKLKRLYISRCSGIKNIFPATLLQNNFPTLEELSVEYCENVKEIIVDENVEMSRKTITLPNLKSICLRHLPALESIYKGTIVSTSLKEIKLGGSPMLKRLPFSCSHTNDCQQRASLAPVFPSIDGEQIWGESMESVLFREVAPAGDISFKLKELSISFCSGIKNIFPAMLLQNNFPNLEKLKVTNCENVKEIIVDEDVEMSRKTITLPNLKYIHLICLPALESIYKGTMVCTSLVEIRVWDCPMLKRLSFSCSHTNDSQQRASPAPVFPSIEGEQIWRESMESVLFREVAPAGNISFKLKSLSISFCSGIKNIFPAMLLQNNFPTLEKLSVAHCENVKEIIVDEDVEMSRKTITLPNLKIIYLAKLPALESIYKGTMVSTSLYEIYVRECPNLKRLPFSCSYTDDCQQHASPAPVFPTIEGEQIWWESLEWDDDHTKTAFQRSFKMM